MTLFPYLLGLATGLAAIGIHWLVLRNQRDRARRRLHKIKELIRFKHKALLTRPPTRQDFLDVYDLVQPYEKE